jgi:hypothetical protein
VPYLPAVSARRIVPHVVSFVGCLSVMGMDISQPPACKDTYLRNTDCCMGHDAFRMTPCWPGLPACLICGGRVGLRCWGWGSLVGELVGVVAADRSE